MNPPIVLITDFGISDPFVGIMKGVIASISPNTPTIDLTHDIPPGDIKRATLTLWVSIYYFPKGSIFLTVIDPGVGTQRRPIILESKDYFFVGPDNGVFTYIMDQNTRAWELSNPQLRLPNPRNTFHGRDIFAPSAAYAALGRSASEFGIPATNLTKIQNPRFVFEAPGKIHGEILYADRFGNILTSLGIFTPSADGLYSIQPLMASGIIPSIDLTNAQLQLPNSEQLPFVSTFAQIPPDECAAVIGSSGLIEIAANRQSAAKLLNLVCGDQTTLNFPPTLIQQEIP